jgi:tetratricopeptide (TPR) repeat protein
MNRIVSALILLCTLAAGVQPARAERAGAADPSNSEAARTWQASYSAESAGNYEAALRALEQLPAAQKHGYIASFRRGWLQYCLGRHAEAVAAYAAAIKLEPDAVEARVAQLLPLMAAGKWTELIKAAQDTLKRDPQNYLALQRMAYAQYSSQRFPEAEQSYRRLVKLYPSDVEMRAALGWAVLRLGKQPEATELFRTVLELSPKHASATAGLQASTAAHGVSPY